MNVSATNNSVAAIGVAFAILACFYMGIGGSFDKQFWLASLPGLMQNLAILAVGIFVFDSIFKREKLDKLERTNESQSRFVLLLSSQLAFKILQHLGLATMKEASEDPALNFEFALDRLKTTDLSLTFYEKLQESVDKEAFIQGFEKEATEGIDALSKALEKIYPRPDPELEAAVQGMSFSNGSASAIGGLVESFNKANLELPPDKQLTVDQLNLLIKLMFQGVGPELTRMQNALVELAESARSNQLFLSFD